MGAFCAEPRPSMAERVMRPKKKKKKRKKRGRNLKPTIWSSLRVLRLLVFPKNLIRRLKTDLSY